MMGKYRTMRGVLVDIASIARKNKNTLAVSPAAPPMNAEGKPIKGGTVSRTKVVSRNVEMSSVGKLNPKFSNKFKNAAKVEEIKKDEIKTTNDLSKNEIKKKAKKDAEKLLEKFEIISKED